MYFERKGDAAKVLAVKEHRISDRIVEVLAATADHINLSFDNTIEAASPIDSILDLNDDCLIQIFEMLPQSDRLSILDTCSRLRTIAQRTMRVFNLTKIVGRDDDITEATRIIKMIGSSINNLQWDTDCGLSAKRVYDVFKLIDKYCSSLKSLNMACERGFVFSSLRRIVKKLESFELELYGEMPDKHILNCANLFSRCHNLVNLTIDCDDGYEYQEFFATVFENFHSQLECLNFRFVNNISYKTFENIIQNPNRLRDLHLNLNGFVRGADYRKILELIVRSCSKTLKLLHLKIKCTDELPVPILQDLFRNVESLTLEGEVVPPVHGLFASCQNLQTLKLIGLSNVCDATTKNDFPEVKYLVIRNLSDDVSKQIRFLSNFGKMERLSISLPNGRERRKDTNTICETIVGMK